MTRTITGFLFAVIALLLSLSVSAQVKYQPEMDDFLGEWIHPRNHKVDEFTVLISKRGDYALIRMKYRPAYCYIEDGILDDRYYYWEFENITFDNNHFTLIQTQFIPDSDVIWSIFYKNGLLEVYRDVVSKSKDHKTNEKYILYPNESNF